MFCSVFNDVLGPIMRGPSSSHTAGSYHIGLVSRQLLGAEPKKITISFDPDGSYGNTYVQQGVDQAFITGLMKWKQTDEIFTSALATALDNGALIDFKLRKIPQADHPNYVILELEDTDGQQITVEAKSVGGGTFKIVSVDGCEILLDGKTFETLLTVPPGAESSALEFVHDNFENVSVTNPCRDTKKVIIQLSSDTPLPFADLLAHPAIIKIQQAQPVYYTQKSPAPFSSGTAMQRFATTNNLSLGEAVLEYEKTVLGISEDDAIAEMLHRYSVMKQSVVEGLKNDKVDMLLLEPMAGEIMNSIKADRVAIGGLHAKAGAAAMAAMHSCNSRGVVCAAPTGGAAGTLPGILTALDEEYKISDRQMALMLFAAGGIGLILAIRATFAAEVAGCQVEIGAAGAMGAAAVVEFAGGTAQQGCDAAAISFQNTMGSVCDLVQGMCEIPCHTRNAAAASSAFTNADMVLGGYINHINLDETIDAVYSSGLMLPKELRCTARGGLALAPSAKTLKRGAGHNP
ncbi:MAG: L-serine ammonia-lyase, iron-sulfur-dependent, subunit alpha [Desulforhopalus sp.]